MNPSNPDIVVLRKNTEGLAIPPYVQLIKRKLPEYAVAHARTPAEERHLIKSARFATGVSFSEDLFNHAENLELFVVASSGYGHLPLDLFQESGIALANAAGIHAPGIAEQVIGYCMMFARNLHIGWQRNLTGQWRHYKAREFANSTVTIVGLGSIGRAVVDRLEGFNVRTVGVRYTPEKGGPTDEVIGFDEEEFHAALAETDYLILATPLSETTEGLISEAEFNTLPPKAVVINVCRGKVVNTDALLVALQKEDIRGAALDVTEPEPLQQDSPLWQMNNVLITPHMGGHTPKHWERLADIFAANVEKIDTGMTDNLTNQVLELKRTPAVTQPTGDDT